MKADKLIARVKGVEDKYGVDPTSLLIVDFVMEGWKAGEACLIAEIERLAQAAETTTEPEILSSLIKHLTLQETLEH